MTAAGCCRWHTWTSSPGPLESIDSPDVRVAPVAEVRGLAFDHDWIVERLRSEYRNVPDPRELLEDPHPAGTAAPA